MSDLWDDACIVMGENSKFRDCLIVNLGNRSCVVRMNGPAAEATDSIVVSFIPSLWGWTKLWWTQLRWRRKAQTRKTDAVFYVPHALVD